MSQHARNTAIFSVLTLGSRLSGLVRIMVFAYAIGGRNVLADSYQLAYLIPSTIYEFIVGGVLSAIFIPLLVREQEQHGKTSGEAWSVANLLLGAVGVILAATGLVGFIASPWIIKALTGVISDGSIEEKQALATHLFRYFTPQIFLLGINAVFMAILNSLGVFAVTAAAPIVNNFVVIGVFLAYYFGWIDVTGLAVGTTLGTAAMILVQLPWLLKLGMQVRPKFDLRHPVFKSVTQMGWPVLLVSIANLFGWAVRTNLLYPIIGAMAIYTLSFQIIMMPYGIFAVSIATVLYPALSRHAANNRMSEFAGDMSLGFRWTTFILLPISLGIAVLALPIVRVLFEHKGGQFTFADSLFAGRFLGYYALSIAPYALVMFATRVFYSMKDTATPAAINIVGVVINAVVSYLLLKAMGAAGIAVAAAVTYTVTTTASMAVIKQRTGGLGGKSFWIPLVKMSMASALMAFAVHAAEVWSRPEVEVVERGTRLVLPIPESGSRGNSVAIKSEEELGRIWTALGRDRETVPKIDFQQVTMMLAWGPQSKTTSTLHLDVIRRPTSPGEPYDFRATVAPTTRTTVTLAADAPTSPAYALVQVRQRGATLNTTFAVAAAPAENGFDVVDSELIRLGLLIGLGAFIYVISAFLFRMEELESLISKFSSKFRRRRPEPEKPE